MPERSPWPKKLYQLDCCWVCRLPLRTPLHRCEPRHLGLPRLHQDCFDPMTFERLQVNHVVTVNASDYVEEQSQVSVYEQRNLKKMSTQSQEERAHDLRIFNAND